MTATETLRQLLDERGVEKWTSHSVTMWGKDEDGSYRYMAAPFYVDGRLRVYGLDPEQAVEATLERGTCRNTQEDFDFMCSECGKCVDNGRVLGFNYCPKCGREIEA